MKKIIPLTILLFGLLTSCSNSKKESLLKSYFLQIQLDHEGWKNVIETSLKDTIYGKELKRLFFSFNQTVPFEKRDVVLVGRYFNLGDAILFEHELLMDEKDNLLSPFFSDSDIDKAQLRELLKIENEIIEVLNKIEKEIDGK